MNKTVVLSVIVIGIIVLGGYSLYKGSQKSSSNVIPSTSPAPVEKSFNTNSTVTPTTQSSPTESNASTVNIQNFAFTPATLTVKKGTAVTWTNDDSASHQIKSTTFNSSLMSKGQSFSFTFNEVGTFDYICSVHPSMTGKIIVE